MPTPLRLLTCRRALVLALLCAVGSAHASDDTRRDRFQDRQLLDEQDRAWRADIRASVSQFAHISADDNRPQRQPMSDAERSEMRRDIDEAIRKAYGKRQRPRH